MIVLAPRRTYAILVCVCLVSVSYTRTVVHVVLYTIVVSVIISVTGISHQVLIGVILQKKQVGYYGIVYTLV